MDEKTAVATALYQAEFGKMVLNYVGKIDPAVIEKAMESRAIRTLEAIRWVLENDQFDDPECFERVDALVMTFFRELEINVNRHNELD